MSDPNYELLETETFSISSPRKRNAKRVQQELIRANERRSRPRKIVIERYLNSSKQQTAKVAHLYLPEQGQNVQNAVDLFITSELQKMSIPVKDVGRNTSNNLVQTIIQKFFAQPVSIQQQFLNASVLSQTNTTKPCSDPFLIFMDLHKRQSKLNHPRLNSRRPNDTEIGPFAVNIKRAETGEEPDPTRFHFEDDQQLVADAKALWNGMSPDLKLPFFMQAFLASHFPESLDQAL
ncbi:uncharacterized protein LOC131678545 [Topomyia yanbarensis]|uniref:uncharacterized protein LOC131678545 n=1 Tax=Topomyia yanbarensis TaxID=2498891 RepID=UPI00273C09AE|nr:uncharacterized protein LOC131678545 [Topomyia yanbarensis]XP_058814742.1 uncharacterized protein LOC131678545 [Topomyia yanbarensis]